MPPSVVLVFSRKSSMLSEIIQLVQTGFTALSMMLSTAGDCFFFFYLATRWGAFQSRRLGYFSSRRPGNLAHEGLRFSKKYFIPYSMVLAQRLSNAENTRTRVALLANEMCKEIQQRVKGRLISLEVDCVTRMERSILDSICRSFPKEKLTSRRSWSRN